jgi:hypothetical protein
MLLAVLFTLDYAEMTVVATRPRASIQCAISAKSLVAPECLTGLVHRPTVATYKLMCGLGNAVAYECAAAGVAWKWRRDGVGMGWW